MPYFRPRVFQLGQVCDRCLDLAITTSVVFPGERGVIQDGNNGYSPATSSAIIDSEHAVVARDIQHQVIQFDS